MICSFGEMVFHEMALWRNCFGEIDFGEMDFDERFGYPVGIVTDINLHNQYTVY
jgi:hypothetical protein